jgi:polysaccharide biosynthesis protein PslF
VLLPYGSHDQATSGVLVEALASGRPVVAPRFPHAVEMLARGAGIVVDHDNPQAMADALSAIVNSPDLAARMTHQARIEASPLLWPAVARRYQNLVTAITGDTHRGNHHRGPSRVSSGPPPPAG